MNKTISLVSVISGLAGAGIAYAYTSKTTIDEDDESKFIEPNLNHLNPTLRKSKKNKNKYDPAIKISQELVNIFKDEFGTPCIVVGVSVNGDIIWEEGFGYANLETRTPCHANTVMRIASISKPITTTLLAKLKESKKVNYDNSVYDYVHYFPPKKIDGENVDITVRQLASHTGGIRDYKKKGEKADEEFIDLKSEFYYKERIDNVEKSIDMFKNDELIFKPGTSFEYTTHGYTLLSAVIENAGGKPFTTQIQNMLKVLGLHNTHLDRIQTLIHGRASYYNKNKHGNIINAELADTSYKWAGGGLVSTVGDLLKFGNIMLYCYQQRDSDKPGYLRKDTVEELWSPVEKTVMHWGMNSGYGLGWTVVPKVEGVGGVNENQQFCVGHSGGAVGASSVLYIVPKELYEKINSNENEIDIKLPQGVVVAILVNLQNISCKTLAKNIAHEFIKHN